MSRTDRWAVIAGNLLPLAGVAFFGWSAAPVIFVIWLDVLLCNLQLAVPAMAIGRREDAEFRKFGAVQLAIALLAGLLPSIVLGLAMDDLLGGRFPKGLATEAFAARGVVLWVALALILHGVRILSLVAETRSHAAAAAFKARGADQLMNLLCRVCVLATLAVVSDILGRAGLMVFLVLATAFMTYVELHENWMAHWQGKIAALEEKRGENP